jgi:alkaline phosphatase D
MSSSRSSKLWLPITRRQLLIGGALVLAGATIDRTTAADAHLFSLGVASGEPMSDGFVLWTRLATLPLDGGGMPPKPVEVLWEVATDEGLGKVVQRGTAMALPEWGHSVHIEVSGLEPERTYWYRFRSGGESSPVGRTRTAPAPGSLPKALKFAFCSCQHYESGYYTAYRDMARQDLDFVVHLGDYIYESGQSVGKPRRHNGSEIRTLTEYRNRYALYRSDPDLQAAHAAFPWIVTWDDHEFSNNYAGDIPENSGDAADFLKRRAIAYQAYYEHMPLRPSQMPVGANMQLYRRLSFGQLAQFQVLDTRQYRSDQPCGDHLKPLCPETLSPTATMTGAVQEQWLFDGLTRSTASWNILAQQVVFSRFDVDPRANSTAFNMDQWDGYVAARNRLLGAIVERKPANPVILSGDVHSSWVFDLKRDFEKPDSPTIGTEFVGTSITSEFSKNIVGALRLAMPSNPHTRFFDGEHRGYTICTLSPKQWTSEYRAVADATVPNSTMNTLATFVVEAGKPGAIQT